MTLKELLHEKNITIEELSNRTDLPYETIRNIYYGKVNDPRVSSIVKICNALGVSYNTLLETNQLQEDEEELLEAYRKCNQRGKQIATLVLELNEYKEERGNKIEVLVPSEHENDGITNKLCSSEWVEVNDERVYCGYKIMTNNFVNSKICYGDIILLEKRIPKEHEKGVFYKDGKSYFRTLESDKGKYILKSMNEVGKDFIVDRLDEFVVIGTCIGIK